MQFSFAPRFIFFSLSKTSLLLLHNATDGNNIFSAGAAATACCIREQCLPPLLLLRRYILYTTSSWPAACWRACSSSSYSALHPQLDSSGYMTVDSSSSIVVAYSDLCQLVSSHFLFELFSRLSRRIRTTQLAYHSQSIAGEESQKKKTVFFWYVHTYIPIEVVYIVYSIVTLAVGHMHTDTQTDRHRHKPVPCTISCQYIYIYQIYVARLFDS